MAGSPYGRKTAFLEGVERVGSTWRVPSTREKSDFPLSPQFSPSIHSVNSHPSLCRSAEPRADFLSSRKGLSFPLFLPLSLTAEPTSADLNGTPPRPQPR